MIVPNETDQHNTERKKIMKKDELKLLKMSDIQVREVDWLWYPYIPFGKLTIIHGDPGEGKTTFALRLAAACSTGTPLPNMDTIAPITVIYQSAEDGLDDTVKPRLIEAGADQERIINICEEEKSLHTIQFDWLLNAAQTHYYLRISVSDNHNSATVEATGCTMPVEAKRFDLDVMCLAYTNTGAYKLPANYPRLDSIEYHLNNYGLTAPAVDGARFKDPSLGVQDISYQISYDNSAPLPDGYSAVAYGAALMTEQKLVNPYDIIDLYYRGEGDLPVLTAQKVLAAGESVPDTYLVSVKDSASRISGSDADIRGVRFAIVAYVMYTDAQGNLICVYSFNNNDKAVSYGQVSKSVTGVAKQIAANEIANMQGKEGAAEAEEINAIEAILAKAQTTAEEKDTLIAFVGKYTQFIQQ